MEEIFMHQLYLLSQLLQEITYHFQYRKSKQKMQNQTKIQQQENEN